MHAKPILLMFIAFIALTASGVHAANLRFLDQTPITFLSKKDKAALQDAAVSVLDHKKDGETLQWSNEGLGNSVGIHAEVTATDTMTSNEKYADI